MLAPTIDASNVYRGASNFNNAASVAVRFWEIGEFDSAISPGAPHGSWRIFQLSMQGRFPAGCEPAANLPYTNARTRRRLHRLPRSSSTGLFHKHSSAYHRYLIRSQSSFATYVPGTERSVVKIPSDVPLEIMGPPGCGVQTGAGTVINSLHPQAGDSIAIYGAGSVGLSALLGATVTRCAIRICVDPNEDRLRFALELGATHVINPRTADPVEEIQKITGGLGTQFSPETSGNLTALRQAVDSIQIMRECGMIGAPAFGSQIGLDTWKLLLGRRIRGICEGDSVPGASDSRPEAAQYSN